MQKKTVWGGVISIVVSIVVLLLVGFLLFGTPAEAPTVSDSGGATTTDTSAATTTEDLSIVVSDTAVGGEESGESALQETNIRPPDIAVTPYSAFIGFAAEVGTSTANMNEEVSEVVVGYEWESLIGSPHFSTIMLPDWTEGADISKKYTVSVWNKGVYEVLGAYPAGQEIEFPREGFNGARKFKVIGIDPNLRICPGDRSFTWNARFVFEGNLGIVRTPITQDLLAGETCRMRQ